MFKIIFGREGNLYSILEGCEDPHIVDIRNDESDQLKKVYEKDYTHIQELTNKGLTCVILRHEEEGLKRLGIFVDKCKEFERELVITYKDEAVARFVEERLREVYKEELPCLYL